MDGSQIISSIPNLFLAITCVLDLQTRKCNPTLNILLFKSLIWTRFCALNLIPNIQNIIRFQFSSLNSYVSVGTHFLALFQKHNNKQLIQKWCDVQPLHKIYVLIPFLSFTMYFYFFEIYTLSLHLFKDYRKEKWKLWILQCYITICRLHEKYWILNSNWKSTNILCVNGYKWSESFYYRITYIQKRGVMNTFANLSLNFYTSTHSKLHQCFNCFN